MRGSLTRLSIRSLGIVLFSAYIYAAGFLTGRFWPAVELVVESPVQIQATQIMTELSRATSTLINCEDFRLGYPERYKRFAKRIKQSFKFGYHPLTEPATYAYVHELSGVIVLTDDFFASHSRERERIIAHESLHLVGFPNHASPLVIAKDEIYQLVNKCYPWDLPDIDEPPSP